MPQYKDGTLAAVGDQVYGHVCDSPRTIAGTVISVSQHEGSPCNVLVQYTLASPYQEDVGAELPFHVAREERDGIPYPIHRKVRGANHGTSGPEFLLFTCIGYCFACDLIKVG